MILIVQLSYHAPGSKRSEEMCVVCALIIPMGIYNVDRCDSCGVGFTPSLFSFLLFCCFWALSAASP